MLAPALVLAALFALAWPPEVFARAGGGHHGGGGLLYIIVLPFVIIYAWYVNKRINEKKRLTEEAMTRMAAKDPAWEESKIEAFVREDFIRIEKAWCDKDYVTLHKRLTEGLFQEWKAQLHLMSSQGHRNVMENLSLEQVRFVEAKDYRVKDRDEFTVCLDASATDYTIDADGKIVDSNAASRRARVRKQKQQSSFREFWTYHRKGQDWLLAAVDQSGQWSKSVDAPIVEEG
jgi:predicted lipid-binding transport protein (Tim44 family)